jgi:oligopeptide/dipeptide ABC transporter ATP-binding protein
MGVIARMADRVAVMYAGEVAELAQCKDLLAAPAHPYTRLLLAAMPSAKRRLDRLPIIPGQMPAPGAMPTGCRFHPRCPEILEKCRELCSPMQALDGGREARCWRAGSANELRS